MRMFALMLMLTFSLFAADNRKDVNAGSLYDILPHIVDGGNWKSTIILTNLETQPVSWTVKFFSDTGAPMEFDIAGKGKSSIFAGVVPVNGVVTLETPGAGALRQGWAEVSASGGDDVGAMVIFGTRNVPGRPDYEATVPGVFSIEDDVVIPFDNSNGFVTSIAILNPGSFTDVEYQLKICDENGNQVASEIVTLKPGHKIAFATPDRWSASAGRRGTIQLKGSSWTSSLAFRFHPQGAFTTVFPMER